MDEERKMILKMVEDGKITAEDGAKLLKALTTENDKTNEDQNGRKDETFADIDENVKINEGSQSDEQKKQTETRELSTGVNWHEGENWKKYWEKERETIETGAKKFTGFIEDAVKKIKELDLDFNFGPFVEVKHTFQHQVITQSFIDIAFENGSLDIEPWDEDGVKVDCQAKVYKAKHAEAARKEFLQDTQFEVEGDSIRLYTKSKSIKINATLFIPKNTFKRIQLYTFNGHLKGKDLYAKTFNAKAVNGSLNFENMGVERLNAETINGPIKLYGGAIDQCDIQTMNGTVEMESVIRDVEAETVNGTINGSLYINEDARASLSASTGSVFVTLPRHIQTIGDLKTNIGNYNCSLPNVTVKEEKRDFIQKEMSFVSNENGAPVLHLEAQTKTGSLSVKPRDH